MSNGVPQADRQQDGLRQWQNYVPQHLQLIGPIEPRRFLQLVGQTFEETFHHQHVVDIDGTGQDHCLVGVDEIHSLHDQIGGDQTSVEQERDQRHRNEKLTARQIGSRKSIGEWNRQQHVYGGST